MCLCARIMKSMNIRVWSWAKCVLLVSAPLWALIFDIFDKFKLQTKRNWKVCCAKCAATECARSLQMGNRARTTAHTRVCRATHGTQWSWARAHKYGVVDVGECAFWHAQLLTSSLAHTFIASTCRIFRSSQYLSLILWTLCGGICNVTETPPRSPISLLVGCQFLRSILF